MAWDSYSVSVTLDGDVEANDFKRALDDQLRRLGSVRLGSPGDAIAQFKFRPRGQLLRTIGRLEMTRNKRTNHLVVNVSGKTELSLAMGVLVFGICILTSGLLLPVFLLAILFRAMREFG